MRVHRFDNAPRPLTWLPNREGFKFIAVLRDGTEVECVTMRVLGVILIDKYAASDLKGWKPLPVTRTQGMWI